MAQAAPVLANLRNLAVAEFRANNDSLTGLPNRRATDDTLKRLVAQANRAADAADARSWSTSTTSSRSTTASATPPATTCSPPSARPCRPACARATSPAASAARSSSSCSRTPTPTGALLVAEKIRAAVAAHPRPRRRARHHRQRRHRRPAGARRRPRRACCARPTGRSTPPRPTGRDRTVVAGLPASRRCAGLPALGGVARVRAAVGLVDVGRVRACGRRPPPRSRRRGAPPSGWSTSGALGVLPSGFVMRSGLPRRRPSRYPA